MRILNQQTESLVKELVGSDVLPLLKILKERKNINEFTIADKLSFSINQVRNKLYKLQEYNLVTSTRKKDKKKGWYVYYWTLNNKELKRLYLELKRKKLDQLSKEFKRDQQESIPTFICPNKCYKFNIEDAMEISFKCPECGSILKEENKKIRLKYVEREISNIKKELNIKA